MKKWISLRWLLLLTFSALLAIESIAETEGAISSTETPPESITAALAEGIPNCQPSSA